MDAEKNTSGSASSGLTDQKYTPSGQHLDSSETVNADASPTASPIEEEEFRARSVAASPLPYVTDVSQTELLSVASCSAQPNTLDELINYISELLQLMETKKTPQELIAAGAERPQELIAAGAERPLNSIGEESLNNTLKPDAPSSRKASVRGFVKGISSSHCITACLLLVANISERFPIFSANRTECMSLLQEIIMLLKAIKKMKQTTALTEKSEDLIKEALELSVEAAIFSCIGIRSASFSRWLSKSRDKRKLRDLRKKVINMSSKLEREIMIQAFRGMTTYIEKRFPEYAVGIERPAEDIRDSENEQEMQLLNISASENQETDPCISEYTNLEQISASENQETHPCISEYTNLEQKLRESLHDIYSFFNEWDWSEVANIVGDSELETLETKALVIKDANSTVKVHDAIIPKCREDTDGMVVTSASQIRALLDKKGIKDFERITGIWLLHENKDPSSMPAEKLDLMCGSLRVLALGKFGKVEGKCRGVFDKMVFFQAGIPQRPFAVSKMKKLRYFSFNHKDFQLQKGYSNTYKRLNSKLQYPRALRMESHRGLSIEMRRTGNDLKLLKLYLREQKCRCLDRLRHKRSLLSLVTLWDLKHPEDPYDRYGLFVALKDALFGLKKLTSLEDLPHRLGNLICLGREIDLLKRHEQSSIYLESLARLMSILCSLEISSCSVSDDSPDLLRDFPLKQFSLARCSSLEKLLNRFGELKSLRVLNLQDCWLLKKLPEGLHELKCLVELDLSFCCSLEDFCPKFHLLPSLRILNLTSCDSLKELPEGLYELKCLVELHLSFCCSLEDFCTNFHLLPSLQILNLTSCDSLKKLPKDFHRLGALEILSLKFCKTLEGESMDNVIKCKTLKMLFIEGSPMLQERWEAIKSGEDYQSSSLKVYTKEEATSDKDNRAYEP